MESANSPWLRIASRNYSFLIGMVALFAAIQLPLTSSLWLDETLTYWIIRDGYREVIDRTLNFQGQSPLYFLLEWGWAQLFGISELTLRMPSLILVAFTALLVFKIARRLVDSECAGLATLLFLILDATSKSAISARPYALSLFLATASTEFLLRWREAPTQRNGLYYAIAIVAAFYTHYLVAAIGIVHLVLILTSRSELRRAHLQSGSTALILSALLSFPGLLHLKAVSDRSALYIYPMLPSATDLLKAFAPLTLLLYLAVAALIARIFIPFSFNFRGISPISTKFLICWWIFPPLLFFAYSHVSGGSLFLWRFYHWYTPALAILAAILIRAFTSSQARAIAACTITLLTLLVARNWQTEDWRQITELIRKEQTSAEPILIYPGLIELNDISWAQEPGNRDYILAPFGYYKLDVSQALILPSAFESEEALRYFEQAVTPKIASSESFLLISPTIVQLAPAPASVGNPSYLINYFKRMGFTARQITSGSLIQLFRLGKSSS